MPSVADSILDAAVSALQGVTWDPTPSKPFTVKKRKIGAVEESEMPAIIVSLESGPTPFEPLTAVSCLATYSLVVEIAVGGGQKLADTAPLLAWREQARNAVSARNAWAGVAGWNRTASQDLTAFDRAALGKGASVSLQRFSVEAVEPRG